MERVKTIWESCVLQARPSGALKKVANGDINFGFSQKKTDTKTVAVETT